MANGGLDTAWRIAGGEDRDLCRRWSNSGRPLAEAPGAVVIHRQSMSWSRFLRQHFNYGRGAWQHLRRNGPAADVSALRRLALGPTLTLAPFRMFAPARALPIALLAGLSQAVTLAGFLSQALRTAATSGASP